MAEEFHAAERLEARQKVQTTMRVLRERASLSQTDLAGLLGRAQPEISMWEWGHEPMTAGIKQKVCEVLQLHLQSLGQDARHLTPEDLDRPWDEVLIEWRERSGTS